MTADKSELYNNTIRQLKNVNFVLLTLVSVMAIFVLLASKPKVEIAIDDLKNLESAFEFDPKARSKPLYGTEWLSELAQKKIDRNKITFTNYYFEENSKTYRLNYQNFEIPNGPKISDSKILISLLRFDGSISIQELKELWNGISRIENIVYVKSLSDYMAKYDKEKNKFIYQKKDIHTNFDGMHTPTGPLALVDVSSERWIDDHFSEYKDVPSVKEKLVQMTYKPNVSSRYYIFGKTSSQFGFDFRAPGSHSVPDEEWEEYEYSKIENALSGEIFIPVSVGKIDFYPQKQLIQNVPKDFGWKLGNFSVNFSELDEFTKGYQDLPIDKIKIILEKELERSPGSVSAFGLSIPFSIVSKFGVLAIIIIQTYFLLYLIYLHKSFDSEYDLNLEVPWVFMHGSIFSAIAFISVSVAYPALIAMFFSWVNISSSISNGWIIGHIALAIVEIVIIVMLVKYIFLFRHMKNLAIFNRKLSDN